MGFNPAPGSVRGCCYRAGEGERREIAGRIRGDAAGAEILKLGLAALPEEQAAGLHASRRYYCARQVAINSQWQS